MRLDLRGGRGVTTRDPAGEEPSRESGGDGRSGRVGPGLVWESRSAVRTDGGTGFFTCVAALRFLCSSRSRSRTLRRSSSARRIASWLASSSTSMGSVISSITISSIPGGRPTSTSGTTGDLTSNSSGVSLGRHSFLLSSCGA